MTKEARELMEKLTTDFAVGVALRGLYAVDISYLFDAGYAQARKEAERFNNKTKGAKVKKLVQVQEIEGEGLEALIGETVTIFCQIYIYTGKLVGVSDRFILLEKAKVVYETGAFSDKDWKDAQSLPGNWYIKTNSIESFGLLK